MNEITRIENKLPNIPAVPVPIPQNFISEDLFIYAKYPRVTDSPKLHENPTKRMEIKHVQNFGAYAHPMRPIAIKEAFVKNLKSYVKFNAENKVLTDPAKSPQNVQAMSTAGTAPFSL